MIKSLFLFMIMCGCCCAQDIGAVVYYQPQPVVVQYPVIVYYPVQPVISVQYVPVVQQPIVMQNNNVIWGNWPIVNERPRFWNSHNGCWNRGVRYSYGY